MYIVILTLSKYSENSEGSFIYWKLKFYMILHFCSYVPKLNIFQWKFSFLNVKLYEIPCNFSYIIFYQSILYFFLYPFDIYKTNPKKFILTSAPLINILDPWKISNQRVPFKIQGGQLSVSDGRTMGTITPEARLILRSDGPFGKLLNEIPSKYLGCVPADPRIYPRGCRLLTDH